MKTKVAKSDFNEINLPKTRFKQFGDIFLREWRTLLLCSLVLFIFAIPYIAKLIFEYIIISGVSTTLDPNLSDIEKAATLISYQNVFNLVSIPCFMIFSISLSGLMRVFKELCFGNGTYFKLDFSRGIKENILITLILSFIFSLLIFLVKYSFNTLYLTNIDYNVLNNIKCNKIQVEFLRVNSWIKKWFDIDYSEYTVKQSGYLHMPLELKKQYISRINGFKEITVCEDETEAYEYWKNNFNPNINDCCNLRKE